MIGNNSRCDAESNANCTINPNSKRSTHASRSNRRLILGFESNHVSRYPKRTISNNLSPRINGHAIHGTDTRSRCGNGQCPPDSHGNRTSDDGRIDSLQAGRFEIEIATGHDARVKETGSQIKWLTLSAPCPPDRIPRNTDTNRGTKGEAPGNRDGCGSRYYNGVNRTRILGRDFNIAIVVCPKDRISCPSTSPTQDVII